MRSPAFSLALLVACSAACVGPRTPRARVPYSVRLLGAADGALRGASRDGRIVFTGSPGRDYAIEVTNDTPSNVGVSILIDGIDAKNGTPATSCDGLGGWIVAADSTGTIRGFAVAANRIATYRFAPRERSLAAIAVGARPESIGTMSGYAFRCFPAIPGPPYSAPLSEALRWGRRETKAGGSDGSVVMSWIIGTFFATR